MANQTTEYVFVCSANFWRYLFFSLRSLFASGSKVERVVVYVEGEGSERWKIRDPRVSIRRVPDIGNGYWGANKIHLCDSPADRLVYLDTDVAILRPIDQLWEGCDEDLIARIADVHYTKYWYPEKWKAALTAAGADDYPFYSPGFMIFQNGSHRRLGETWLRVTQDILANKLPLPANRLAEMYAFSIAASLEHLSHSAMADYGHRYAMIGETHDDAVVHHLGTPAFYRHFLPIERERGWHRRRDLLVPRPRFARLHALHSRVRHRVKTYLHGHRDKRLSD